MFSVVCLCVGIVFGAVAVICGVRLGRNGSTGSAGGQANSAASSGFTVSAESMRDIAEAVERAKRTNEATAEVVQKMRDIIERNRGQSGDGTGDTNTAD